MEKKSTQKQASEKQAASSQTRNTGKSAANTQKSKLDASGSASHSRSATETGKKS